MTGVLSEETKLRDEIAVVGKSLFDRALTFGSTGNISARLGNGNIALKREAGGNAAHGRIGEDRDV